MKNEIRIAGGGPAGSAAAIAALSGSAPVRLLERSRFPRHKVCGEFISPEACAIVERLGAWSAFSALRPARICSCMLHFGRYTKRWALEECAFGLSRLALDKLLLERAESLGASVCRGEIADWRNERAPEAPLILAVGRRRNAPRQNRLFGFKAHFEGPGSDAIEMYFDRRGYVGVNPIENGRTNVCGIAPEHTLRSIDFRIDEMLRASERLSERLGPLSRTTPWFTVGPLVFSNTKAVEHPGLYPAGDALGFVDPFTGSGILNALLTGSIAGAAAAREMPAEAYLRECQRMLAAPFAISALFRRVLAWNWAEHLAPFVPGEWLFRMTRAAALRSAR